MGDINDEIRGQSENQEEPATKDQEEVEEKKEGEEGEAEATEETRPRREPEEEEKDENDDKQTLDDYFANKKRALPKKEARKVEEVKKANLEKVETQKQKVTTQESNLRNMETYTAATAKTEHASLLGFSKGLEEDDRGERGERGRGGRGFRGG